MHFFSSSSFCKLMNDLFIFPPTLFSSKMAAGPGAPAVMPNLRPQPVAPVVKGAPLPLATMPPVRVPEPNRHEPPPTVNEGVTPPHHGKNASKPTPAEEANKILNEIAHSLHSESFSYM